MSNVFSSVGTSLAISAGLPTTLDATGYAAKSYSVIGEVSEIPEFGPEQALVTFTPLSSGIVEKRGGSVDYGEVTLTVGLTESDAGQLVVEGIVNGAVGADKRASFRVQLPGNGGDTLYFVGAVRSFRRNIGNSDAIATASVIVSLTSPVLKVSVAPTP